MSILLALNSGPRLKRDLGWKDVRCSSTLPKSWAVASLYVVRPFLQRMQRVETT